MSAQLTDEGMAKGGQHKWKMTSTFSWFFCEVCGVVKRKDGKNKPCKGKQKLRTFEPYISIIHFEEGAND